MTRELTATMKVIKLLCFLSLLLVAGLHFYFLALEMFFWEHPLGLKTFSNTAEYAAATAALAKNQGLYNGFLAVGLLWGALTNRIDISVFFLVCVITAGVYGAITVAIKILFVQAVPALIALFLTILSKTVSSVSRV